MNSNLLIPILITVFFMQRVLGLSCNSCSEEQHSSWTFGCPSNSTVVEDCTKRFPNQDAMCQISVQVFTSNTSLITSGCLARNPSTEIPASLNHSSITNNNMPIDHYSVENETSPEGSYQKYQYFCSKDKCNQCAKPDACHNGAGVMKMWMGLVAVLVIGVWGFSS